MNKVFVVERIVSSDTGDGPWKTCSEIVFVECVPDEYYAHDFVCKEWKNAAKKYLDSYDDSFLLLNKRDSTPISPAVKSTLYCVEQHNKGEKVGESMWILDNDVYVDSRIVFRISEYHTKGGE